MISIAIIEDKLQASDLLKLYLKQYIKSGAVPKEVDFSELTVEVFDSGSSFFTAFRRQCFDIIFLDIGLPDIDGMRIAEEIRKTDTKATLIFVTDMAQYAVKGYKVDALDYMVKPINYHSFSRVMERVVSRLERRGYDSVTVKMKDFVGRLALADIVYIEVVNHKLIYHLKNETVTGYGQLKEIGEILDKAGFIQISRYYLVNFHHVKSMKDFVLDLGITKLPVSARRRREVLLKVAEFFEA